jgi:hypothetical protein
MYFLQGFFAAVDALGLGAGLGLAEGDAALCSAPAVFATACGLACDSVLATELAPWGSGLAHPPDAPTTW